MGGRFSSRLSFAGAASRRETSFYADFHFARTPLAAAVFEVKMKVDHITINVTDIQKSEDFYANVLGLEKLPGVRMDDHDLFYFRLDENTRLELIRYDDDNGEVHPAVKTRGIYRHMALEVEDIETLYEHCKKSGAKILCELGYVPQLKFTNFLVEDPNGVEIEVIKY